MRNPTDNHHRVTRQTYHWWNEVGNWLKDHPHENTAPLPLRPAIAFSCQRGCMEGQLLHELSYELRYGAIDPELVEYAARHLAVRCEWTETLNEETKHDFKNWLNNELPNLMKSSDPGAFNACEAMKCAIHHGGVVIMHPAAAMLKGDLRCFRVRLHAPLEHRVNLLAHASFISHDEAQKEIKQADAAERELLKTWFGADINNPALYDLILDFSELNLENVIWKTIKTMRAQGLEVTPRKEKFLR